jgi:hypothetical protein
MDINVQQGGPVPLIRFVLKGSKKRLNEISKVFSSRLEMSSISIVIEEG